MNENLGGRLSAALNTIHILPRRMLLDTPGVLATVPMLRGVWGAALHDLDPLAYAVVFGPNDESRGPPARHSTSIRRPPHRAGLALADVMAATQAGQPAPPAIHAGGTAAAGYVLRPAPPDPEFAPAVEWILIGEAVRHDFPLCRAWDVASGMGLGPERRRFHIRRILALQSDGQAVDQARPWTLGAARWRPASTASTGGADRDLAPDHPCRLAFPSPLRLMQQGRLIERPTLADLVVAACRRVKAYLPLAERDRWDDLSRQALEAARATPAKAWRGNRLDLRRYSGRQHAELELRGVAGYLELPRGPGELRPLLAAATWLHVGKGTVMGLGQMNVEDTSNG